MHILHDANYGAVKIQPIQSWATSSTIQTLKSRRIEADDEHFNKISRHWAEALRNTLIELPSCPEDYWD